VRLRRLTGTREPDVVLSAEQLFDELDTATVAIAGAVLSRDPELPIPACPEWTLRQLVTHVGRAHRWAAEIVGTRATDFIEFRAVPDGKAPGDATGRAQWLTDGAARLADVVRAAGQDLAWSFDGMRPAHFWARRMAHETLVHCADVQEAAGEAFDPRPEFAADAIDEWLRFMSRLNAGGNDLASVLPAGRSLHVHATDPGLGGLGEWLVTHPAEDGVRVLGEHAKSDVALTGPAADVLLVLMRRRPPGSGAVQVSGDAALLDRWIEQTAF